MPEIFTPLLLPLSLISGVMVVWWIYNFAVYRAYKNLKEYGANAQAVITEIDRQKMIIGIPFHRRVPKFRYRFLTTIGSEILSAKKEIPYMMRSREEQDVIMVRYLPEKPKINHMVENLKMQLRGQYMWLFVPPVAWLLLVSPILASTLLGG